MFQYAFGKGLSLKYDTDYYIDVNELTTTPCHQGFQLDKIFNITPLFATPKLIHKTFGWRSLPKIRRLLARYRALGCAKSKNILIQDLTRNSTHYLTLASNNCFLEGYWQNPTLFEQYNENIVNEFSFKEKLSPENERFSDLISNTKSISIHIRRGDYTNNPVHGTCSTQYYNDAMNFFAQQYESVRFFVFSDDHLWASKNLPKNHCVEIINNNTGSQSYIDMRLMSKCNHNIIANSTFSWWGAWLNKNADKQVVAPATWFKSGNYALELIPQNWTTL